jgi:hypothetical protein
MRTYQKTAPEQVGNKPGLVSSAHEEGRLTGDLPPKVTPLPFTTTVDGRYAGLFRPVNQQHPQQHRAKASSEDNREAFC